MSKASPFAGLKLSEQVGLDQRLFSDGPASETTKQRDNETTRARNNGTTKQQDIAVSEQRTNETTNPQVNETTLPRDNHQAHERANETTSHHANAKTAGVVLKRQQKARRFGLPGERLVERHSHDIFRDQVLWINRLKLELEEQYGARVTSNSIVRLAIDRLRADVEADNGDAITATLIEGIYVPDNDPGRRGGGSGSGV
jgi:hypothetical protein